MHGTPHQEVLKIDEAYAAGILASALSLTKIATGSPYGLTLSMAAHCWHNLFIG